ncbi:MAG: SDR family oxidoreductase [Halapricum sp.]
MAPLLDGKTAVVTGGASGFGREISTTFARNGADVVVADLRETPRGGGDPTHEKIRRETDNEAFYVECDVTDPADLDVAVEAADELGGIDVMVNNAGIFRIEDFLDVTEDEYESMMGVNVKGMFFGAQAAAKRMVEHGGGAIINMSSAAGYVGTGQWVTYCTSKGAVRLMTYALADRFGPEGIRVNAINPGISWTEMTNESPLGEGIRGRVRQEVIKRQIPSRRFGQSEEIANVALFLASDLSAYVNGESILVDGGISHTR